jgi:hypothetical protein
VLSLNPAEKFAEGWVHMKVKVERIPKTQTPEKAENLSSKRTLKKWLEDNKIYFETVLNVTLTIAGIIISVFALLHGYEAAKDELMLNLPLFNVTQKYVHGSVTVDGITYSTDQAVEYKIYNQGGELSNGQASGFRILTVSAWDAESENVANFSFEVSDTFLHAGGQYEPTERSFTLYRDKNDYDAGRMVDQIEALLIKDYPYRFNVYWVDYASISYSDYRGDTHKVMFDLYDGSNVPYSNTEPDGHLFGFYSDDIDSVYSTIREKIDLALEFDSE